MLGRSTSTTNMVNLVHVPGNAIKC
ncbi:uncharacterized protein METZ01_LOCUS160109, partial [marine metagenome]